jgi:hypothetical protein
MLKLNDHIVNISNRFVVGHYATCLPAINLDLKIEVIKREIAYAAIRNKRRRSDLNANSFFVLMSSRSLM